VNYGFRTSRRGCPVIKHGKTYSGHLKTILG